MGTITEFWIASSSDTYNPSLNPQPETPKPSILLLATSTQRAKYPSIEEYRLHHNIKPPIVYGIFLN